MTHQEMIQAMKAMDNGERVEFLKYLYREHFSFTSLTDNEELLLSEFRWGNFDLSDLGLGLEKT